MASSSSSPSSCLSLSPSLSGNWEFDVFPSFHGPDVRKSFLSHVLKEFRRKGINMFIDNDIKRGECIGPELKRAIRASKIAVVLLSKNYASSSWCLDELVEIMRKGSGQSVFTVFYDVDPTDIRKQTKHFGEVFNRTCEGKEMEKIETWRKALEDVATIAGYHSRAWDNEASMIEQISVDIADRLSDLAPSREFENCVGLENHVEKLNMLLRLESNEVIAIGIWGPSGIGKSTIARFLFSKLSSCFPNSALMEDIKYSYPTLCFDKRKAKLQLQKKMLSKMFNQSDIVVSHLGVAQQRLRNNKVFLVLDDVDRLEQIDALAGNDFGPGSRIIITTQDRRLLKAIEVNHIYKVDIPSLDEALEMFCMYAFQKKFPEDGFYELACEITWLVGGLPLGLEVMGSYFRGLCKDKDQWSMEVSRLRNNLNGDIERVLKFSYDALCEEDKDLFLELACFYSWRDLDFVEEHLGSRFKDLRQRLYNLEEKSLISTQYHEAVFIHELLIQLGKKIVREELVRESPSGKHQFLNDYKDTVQILTGKKFNGDLGEGELWVIYDSGHPIKIFWLKFPSTCLDSTNNLEFLVELRLTHSMLEKLWEGTKLLPNLKILNLLRSYHLKELPNLSITATNLEELNISYCSSLLELPCSIGNSTNLADLNLGGCSRLVSLPQLPESLSYLNARKCESLEKLDCSFGKAVNQLNFRYCFKLNKEARDLIIQTSTLEYAVLPGEEVPACFTYRASGSSLTVKLNQNHLPTSTKFKACILHVFKGEDPNYVSDGESMRMSCSITSNQENAITPRPLYSQSIDEFSTEHLYIFEFEAEEVTSTELHFTFDINAYDFGGEKILEDWEIKECGVLPIHRAACCERFGGYNREICKRRPIIPFSVKGILSFVAIVFFLTRRRI